MSSHQTAPSLKHPPVQVNPLHVDKIVKEIIKKEHWKDKIGVLENKWQEECLDQGISKASAKVAFDIIKDIKHLGKGVKTCCGCCGANPVKKHWNDPANVVEINPEETLFHKFSLENKRSLAEAIAKSSPESLGQIIAIIQRGMGSGESSTNEIEVDIDKLDDSILSELASFVELDGFQKKPVPNKQADEQAEDEENEENGGEENDDEDEKSYDRSTKFCVCPCKHCAFQVHSVSSDICQIEDDLIPQDLAEELRTQLDKLVEDTPKEKLDWHPGSNNQVLDIIHPSLYCYSAKHSVITTDVKVPKKNVNTQWIPTNFSIDQSNHVTPQSYINNVNPTSQKKLEETICKVLDKFIAPMSTIVDLSSNECQVIVKAANIIVTPEQGSFYPGGTWHTEGNTEGIVATGIYYYHTENVKNSYLEFRRYIDDADIDYEQDNVQEAFENSGLHDGDLLFDHCGSVETIQGRCIVFPNTNQHRVKHFFAEDPTKEAQRKILVFFFVDPKKKIVSTSDIDIQRRDFLMDKYMVLARKLPIELVYSIVGYLPQMSLTTAREVRSQLMAERKFVREYENDEYYEREFSLCEH